MSKFNAGDIICKRGIAVMDPSNYDVVTRSPNLFGEVTVKRIRNGLGGRTITDGYEVIKAAYEGSDVKFWWEDKDTGCNQVFEGQVINDLDDGTYVIKSSSSGTEEIYVGVSESDIITWGSGVALAKRKGYQITEEDFADLLSDFEKKTLCTDKHDWEQTGGWIVGKPKWECKKCGEKC